MSPFRKKGYDCAVRHLAGATAEMIQNGECFPAIFKCAVAEIGITRVVAAVVELDDAWVAAGAIKHISSILKHDVDALYDVITKSEDEHVARHVWWSRLRRPSTACWARFRDVFDVREYPFDGS